jgi:hypothetical protein
VRRLAGCLWSPRLALVLVWLFTDLIEAAYTVHGRLWLAVLGLLFAPLTALAWALIVYYGHDASRWWPALLAAIALFELGLLSRWFRGHKGKKEKGGD